MNITGVFSGLYCVSPSEPLRMIAIVRIVGITSQGKLVDITQPFYQSSATSKDKNGRVKPISFYPIIGVSEEQENYGWLL